VNISVSQNMRMAVDAVWVHRFRSLLTILGSSSASLPW